MNDLDSSGGFSRNERDILIKLLTKMDGIEPIVKSLESKVETNLKSLEDKFDLSLKELHKELDAKYVTKEELKNVQGTVSLLQKIVFGGCGIVLVGVLTALVTLVVPKANADAMHNVAEHLVK